MTDSKERTSLPFPETRQACTPTVRGTFRAFMWAATHFEEVATALLLAIMIASIGLSVFCRYVLHMPLSWTEEVSSI